ncbi:MAG: hypothetical protein AB7K09_11105 [Planctomycetota bacterium]
MPNGTSTSGTSGPPPGTGTGYATGVPYPGTGPPATAPRGAPTYYDFVTFGEPVLIADPDEPKLNGCACNGTGSGTSNATGDCGCDDRVSDVPAMGDATDTDTGTGPPDASPEGQWSHGDPSYRFTEWTLGGFRADGQGTPGGYVVPVSWDSPDSATRAGCRCTVWTDRSRSLQIRYQPEPEFGSLRAHVQSLLDAARMRLAGEVGGGAHIPTLQSDCAQPATLLPLFDRDDLAKIRTAVDSLRSSLAGHGLDQGCIHVQLENTFYVTVLEQCPDWSREQHYSIRGVVELALRLPGDYRISFTLANNNGDQKRFAPLVPSEIIEPWQPGVVSAECEDVSGGGGVHSWTYATPGNRIRIQPTPPTQPTPPVAAPCPDCTGMSEVEVARAMEDHARRAREAKSEALRSHHANCQSLLAHCLRNLVGRASASGPALFLDDSTVAFPAGIIGCTCFYRAESHLIFEILDSAGNEVVIPAHSYKQVADAIKAAFGRYDLTGQQHTVSAAGWCDTGAVLDVSGWLDLDARQSRWLGQALAAAGQAADKQLHDAFGDPWRMSPVTNQTIAGWAICLVLQLNITYSYDCPGGVLLGTNEKGFYTASRSWCTHIGTASAAASASGVPGLIIVGVPPANISTSTQVWQHFNFGAFRDWYQRVTGCEWYGDTSILDVDAALGFMAQFGLSIITNWADILPALFVAADTGDWKPLIQTLLMIAGVTVAMLTAGVLLAVALMICRRLGKTALMRKLLAKFGKCPSKGADEAIPGTPARSADAGGGAGGNARNPDASGNGQGHSSATPESAPASAKNPEPPPGMTGGAKGIDPDPVIRRESERLEAELADQVEQRMKDIGVPEADIGLENFGDGRGFTLDNTVRGGANGPHATYGRGISIDDAFRDPDFARKMIQQAEKEGFKIDKKAAQEYIDAWDAASEVDRMDALIAHEYEEMLSRASDPSGAIGLSPHYDALENAADTGLNISKKARELAELQKRAFGL